MLALLTFVGVHPLVCCAFVAHVVGQVSLFGPGWDVGGEAEQGVVHGQAIVVCRWRYSRTGWMYFYCIPGVTLHWDDDLCVCVGLTYPV